MRYEDIKHFNERIHQRKSPVNAAELQMLLMEEIAELRHYIEVNKPKPAPFFTWHDLVENNNAP